MVEQFTFNERVVGSNPTVLRSRDRRKRKGRRKKPGQEEAGTGRSR